MKDEFSTFAVAKIFKIERTRLQEWMDGGYFKPHVKAKGRGTKTIFTHDDLYRLRLFVWLLTFFNRDKGRLIASDYSNIDFANVGPKKENIKYGCLTGSIAKGELKTGRFDVLTEMPSKKMQEEELFMWIINLEAIKKEVDAMVEGAPFFCNHLFGAIWHLMEGR